MATNNGVTWSVYGGVAGTTIDQTGLLTIDRGETSRSLVIVAVSVDDKTRLDLAILRIENHLTSGVTILNPPESLSINSDYEFQAECFVPIDETDSVTWELSGNQAEQTTINKDTGILSVSENEKSENLFITARSVYDPTMFDFVIVPILNHFVTSLTINPAETSVMQGGSEQFAANLEVPKNESTAVIWEVRGGAPNTTIDKQGLLFVAEDETAMTLAVVARAEYDGTIAFALVNVVPNLQVPEFDAGSEIAYLKNLSGNMSFTTNELLTNNVRVVIDNRWVNESDFTIKHIQANKINEEQISGFNEASADVSPIQISNEERESAENMKMVTVVTVSENFMQSLQKGNHTFAVADLDNERVVPVAFRVFEQNVKTGLTPFKIFLFILICILLLLLICGIIIYNLRRNAIKNGDIDRFNKMFDKLKFVQIKQPVQIDDTIIMPLIKSELEASDE